MNQKTKPSEQLIEGEKFRFTTDPEGTVRLLQQVGTTEIYCPKGSDNPYDETAGVFHKWGREAILIEE